MGKHAGAITLPACADQEDQLERASRTKTDDAKEDVHQVDLGTIEIDTLSSTKQDKWKEYLSVQDMNVLPV